METKVAKDSKHIFICFSHYPIIDQSHATLQRADNHKNSSDESGGETSHTGSRCVSRNGTTWTTEPLAASRRKETVPEADATEQSDKVRATSPRRPFSSIASSRMKCSRRRLTTNNCCASLNNEEEEEERSYRKPTGT
ncbi:conserved hypothetical protein [Trichinella spiralis]|uniref:hypothetical protein n=1 Tax=Trichinella spiralis TaxID=6334 RepID=UPI0001EFE502|nr:conserved hypothetical protein [Trichinella spiralis]